MIDLIDLIEKRRQSGIYWFDSDDDFESIRELTDSMNAPFFRINGAEIYSSDDFHRVAKRDLELFDGYGMNYDAFYDCLIDWGLRDWKRRNWNDAKISIILYDDFHYFLHHEPSWFLTVTNCFKHVSHRINMNYRQYFLIRDEPKFLPDYVLLENTVFY